MFVSGISRVHVGTRRRFSPKVSVSRLFPGQKYFIRFPAGFVGGVERPVFSSAVTDCDDSRGSFYCFRVVCRGPFTVGSSRCTRISFVLNARHPAAAADPNESRNNVNSVRSVRRVYAIFHSNADVRPFPRCC